MGRIQNRTPQFKDKRLDTGYYMPKFTENYMPKRNIYRNRGDLTKYMTAMLTDKKQRDKMMQEKTLEIKNSNGLFKKTKQQIIKEEPKQKTGKVWYETEEHKYRKPAM